MGSIPDQGALKLIVDSLLAKGLMMELTPPGRGQIVTHNLYKERELVELKAQFAGHSGAGVPPASAERERTAGGISAPQVTRDMFNELQLEVAQLRTELAKMRERVKHIELATGVSHSNVELGTDL
jgi:hypothetical protein